MDKVEKEILATAEVMFTRYGLRPVTMDDIASEMSISKKTLYKYISNKEELVQRTVDKVFAENRQLLQSVIEMGGNAIDQLFNVDQAVCSSIENYDHSLQFQLKKYYPEIFASLEVRRKETVSAITKQNIQKGQKEELYRNELNAEIITLLYYSRMVVLTGQEIDPFREFDTRDVMREILLYHIRGMATDKGIRYLEEKLKQTKAN